MDNLAIFSHGHHIKMLQKLASIKRFLEDRQTDDMFLMILDNKRIIFRFIALPGKLFHDKSPGELSRTVNAEIIKYNTVPAGNSRHNFTVVSKLCRQYKFISDTCLISLIDNLADVMPAGYTIDRC